MRNFGIVHDLPASAWDSYMPVADHPEYPSLSASVCAAHSEAARSFLGEDKTRLEPFLFIKVKQQQFIILFIIYKYGNIYTFSITLNAMIIFEKGNSRREFGITPSRNISLGFETWTDFELTCGRSRLYGGVHFVDAVEEVKK